MTREQLLAAEIKKLEEALAEANEVISKLKELIESSLRK